MESKKCIICYTSTVDAAHNAASNIKSTKFEKDTVLNRQLIVVFLLRKFFKTPQDICLKFLQDYGNPSEWIDWCNSCSFLVKRAQCVFDQILLLRKQFDALQVELKTAVQLSETKNKQTSEDTEQNHSRWGATEIIRACLTKSQINISGDDLETSQSAIEVKVENDEEEIDISDVEEGSLLVHNDNCTENEIDPLDLKSEFSPSEFKIRHSNRLKARSLSNNICESSLVNEDIDNLDEGVQSGHSFETTPRKHPLSLKSNEVLKSIRKKFKCELCSRSYTSVYTLRDHFINAHGELPISCEKCNDKMLNEDELRKHNERYHKRAHTASCPKCRTKTFMDERTLRQHCRKEHAKEYYEMFPPKKSNPRFATIENSVDCKKCGKIFVHLGSLRSHCRRYHAEDYSEIFKNINNSNCDKCNMEFTKRRLLKSHYEKEHPNDFQLRYYDQKSKFLSCSRCPYKTFKTAYLQMHLKKHSQIRPTAHHLDNQSNYSVNTEEQTIKYEYDTENDISTHGQTEDNALILENPLSPLQTQTKYLFKEDERLSSTSDDIWKLNPSTDENSDDPDLPEDEIVSSDDLYEPDNKRRKSPRRLKNKELGKIKERYSNSPHKISCPKCSSKTFLHERSLRQHCRKEHSTEYKEMFPPKRAKRRFASLENFVPCKKCGRRFVSVKSMKAHCRNYHADDYSEMFRNSDKNTCDKCKEQFRNRTELKSHYEKEHPKYYKLKYYNRSTMYPCPHCPFKTLNKDYLDVHIDTHTNNQSSSSSKTENDLCIEPKNPLNRESETPASCFGSRSMTKSIANKCPDFPNSISEEFPIPNEKLISLKINTTESNEKFKCEICLRSYSTVYNLKEHFVNFHGELPFSCQKCGAKMVNQEQMINHNEKFHSEANTISCPKCITKTYRTEKSLRLHCRREHPDEYDNMFSPTKVKRTVVTPEESIACEKCGKRFVALKSFKVHVRNYHAESYSEMFEKSDSKTCINCNEKFTTRHDLKSHYEKEHPQDFKIMYYQEKPKILYPCPHCPFKTTKNYLQDHINTHSNLRPYICDLCGVTFKNSKVLKHHQQSKHYKELGIEPFKCKHCGKMFETPAYLQTHINTQHLGKFKYHCHVCSRGFSFPSYLRVHLLRHKGEKPQLCDECGKSFLTTSLLKVHIRTVHKNERPFKCTKCTKTFCSRSRLARHEQGVHNDGSKPHRCQICHKSFPVRNYLYIHMRSHKKRGEVIPKKSFEKGGNPNEKELKR